jgi:hypothetical protein
MNNFRCRLKNDSVIPVVPYLGPKSGPQKGGSLLAGGGIFNKKKAQVPIHRFPSTGPLHHGPGPLRGGRNLPRTLDATEPERSRNLDNLPFFNTIYLKSAATRKLGLNIHG